MFDHLLQEHDRQVVRRASYVPLRGQRTTAACAPRRPFCPWVQWHEAGGARRCGWSWCLDALVPKAADAGAAGGAADAEVRLLSQTDTTRQHFQFPGCWPGRWGVQERKSVRSLCLY